MNRQDALTALLGLDRPLAELRSAIASMEPEAEAAAVLMRAHIAAVLRRFLAGEMDRAAVEQWASLVESCEDIAFEPRHAETIADALFDLANPDLQGALDVIAPTLLGYLEA